MVDGTDALEVTVRGRADGRLRTIRAAQVINCGGPAGSYERSGEPLLATLLAGGEATLDPSGLGLQTRADGRLIDARGRVQTDLSTIGWPMRGTLLEITAVRELRTQARLLADAIIAELAGEAAHAAQRTDS
jgi:uncharacterized NAD(P)/FAD-binding protein YdhS